MVYRYAPAQRVFEPLWSEIGRMFFILASGTGFFCLHGTSFFLCINISKIVALRFSNVYSLIWVRKRASVLKFGSQKLWEVPPAHSNRSASDIISDIIGLYDLIANLPQITRIVTYKRHCLFSDWPKNNCSILGASRIIKPTTATTA